MIPNATERLLFVLSSAISRPKTYTRVRFVNDAGVSTVKSVDLGEFTSLTIAVRDTHLLSAKSEARQKKSGNDLTT